ncbi:unnamed protein product, partial [Ectocarpus sp. 8 AP-2014]
GGGGGGGGGDREEAGRRCQRQPPKHPCLAQFEAYLSHRDDVDFAAGLLKAGFYLSSYLVLGRIMAAAALPEEAGATPAVGRRRLDRLPALRAGGPSAPSWAVLEAEACARPKTWSNPALVRRFEELAGFRLVGEDGRLTLGGFPGWTFDDVAAGAPGLQDSAMGGGRAVSRRAFRHAERLEALERKRAAGGSAVGEAEGEGVEGVSPTVNGSSGGGDGGGSNGATDAPRLNGLLRMPSLNTLDYTPSLAFAPRFEASRFLADLLLLSCNREDYRVRRSD